MLLRFSLLLCLSLSLCIVANADGVASAPDGRRSFATGGACGNVLLIGVRGSGQTEDDYGGWGREMAAVRDDLLDRAQDLVIDLSHIDYPALPVDTLKPSTAQVVGMLSGQAAAQAAALASWTQTRLDKYMASIDDGVAALRAQIERALTECPRRDVVLVGYSQGAMVIHRSLIALDRANKTRELRRIAAVGLLADGDRVAHSDQTNLGSSLEHSRGIAVWATGGRDVPASIADRTYQFCDDQDLVCDASFVNVAHFERGGRIHTHYDATAFRQLSYRIRKGLPTPDFGQVTGRLTFEHPTWGLSTLITSYRPGLSLDGGFGFARVIDSAGRTRWVARAGSGSRGYVYGMSLLSAGPDGAGNFFLRWSSYRWEGVAVLRPVADGMEDFDSITGDALSRWASANMVDLERDGVFEVDAYSNDCVPNCAGGTITHHYWHWDGNDWILPPG